MQSVDQAEVIPGRGIVGDRYYTKTGYWDPVEGCQLTLITQDELDKAQRGNHLSLNRGQHRRNLVIRDVYPSDLKNATFQIGDAIFRYEKPRPPCGYLNKIEGQGMALALSYNSGICVRVVRSGKICIGDRLIIISSKMNT